MDSKIFQCIGKKKLSERFVYPPPNFSPKDFHVRLDTELKAIVLLSVCRETPKSRASGLNKIAMLSQISSSTTRMVRHVTPRELPALTHANYFRWRLRHGHQLLLL